MTTEQRLRRLEHTTGTLISWLGQTNTALSPSDAGSLLKELQKDYGPERPKIVCLCGSTKFYREFQQATMDETLAGKIVLSVGFFTHSSQQAHGQHIVITQEQKVMLDELHKRKIDLADEILVINVDGYIGESTKSEIGYAIKHGKPVRYLHPFKNPG